MSDLAAPKLVGVPVLESERLILRAHRESDFPACAAMWADPNVVKHIGGKPSTEQQSWARLLTYLGHWSIMGFGYWAVEEKSSGSYIGELGFADFKRDLKPSLKGIPELGWALVTRAQGKGYATEALQAAIAWGDAHLAAPKIACIIDPANLASLRVAEKIGFEAPQTVQYAEKPIRLSFRSRPV